MLVGDGGIIDTSDKRSRYGLKVFPAVAVVDKIGRVLHIGRDARFEEDDPVGRLNLELIEE